MSPKILPLPPPWQCWDVQHTWLFDVGPGDQTQIFLLLVWQALCCLSCFSCLHKSLLIRIRRQQVQFSALVPHLESSAATGASCLLFWIGWIIEVHFDLCCWGSCPRGALLDLNVFTHLHRWQYCFLIFFYLDGEHLKTLVRNFRCASIILVVDSAAVLLWVSAPTGSSPFPWTRFETPPAGHWVWISERTLCNDVVPP